MGRIVTNERTNELDGIVFGAGNTWNGTSAGINCDTHYCRCLNTSGSTQINTMMTMATGQSDAAMKVTLVLSSPNVITDPAIPATMRMSDGKVKRESAG